MHSIAYLLHFLVAIGGVATIVWLARKQALPAGVMPGRDLPVWVFALGVAAIVIFELVSFKVSSPPGPLLDFLNAYYAAGESALHHDSATLQQSIGKGISGFVNIPVVAYLFVPFALLPPKVAAVLYTLIGMVLTVVAWFLLVSAFRLELRERWLLTFLFLVNGPLVNGIKWGNLSYFILCALAGGLVLAREGRSAAAGVLLGVATVIKPPLALFGLFFLFRRDVRGVLAYVAVGVVTVLLSLLVFGWAGNLNWFETSILHYSESWLSIFQAQSIPAFLMRLRPGIGIGYTDSIAQIPTHGERFVESILIGLLLIAAATACIRGSARVHSSTEQQAGFRRDLQYLLVLCLVLVASPLSWAHYYSWLLMPTAFFLGSRQILASSQTVRWLSWLAIALATPLVMRPETLGALGQTSVYRLFLVSVPLYAALLWFGLTAWWLVSPVGRQASRNEASSLNSLDLTFEKRSDRA
jgi:hypothetical protein